MWDTCTVVYNAAAINGELIQHAATWSEQKDVTVSEINEKKFKH